MNAGSVQKQPFSIDKTSSQRDHPVKSNQTDLSTKASTFHKPNTAHKNLDPKHKDFEAKP